MKLTFIRLSSKLRQKYTTAAVYILFIVFSPWFLILFKNFRILSIKDIHFIDLGSQAVKYQINTDRGTLIDHGAPIIASKLLINKFTYYSYEISERYFETFDAKYLFFTGDLDIKKSTHMSGPIYLSFLPLILIGLYVSVVKKRKYIWLAPIVPVFGAFVQEHYETISRIPVFIILTYFAAIGLIYIFQKRKILTFSILLLMLFELALFWHNFLIHYPSLLR